VEQIGDSAKKDVEKARDSAKKAVKGLKGLLPGKKEKGTLRRIRRQRRRSRARTRVVLVGDRKCFISRG